MDKQKVRELIAKCNLKEAVSLIIVSANENTTNSTFYDQAIILSMQFYNLEKKISMGLLNSEQEAAAKTKIASRMLQLLSDI